MARMGRGRGPTPRQGPKKGRDPVLEETQPGVRARQPDPVPPRPQPDPGQKWAFVLLASPTCVRAQAARVKAPSDLGEGDQIRLPAFSGEVEGSLKVAGWGQEAVREWACGESTSLDGFPLPCPQDQQPL